MHYKNLLLPVISMLLLSACKKDPDNKGTSSPLVIYTDFTNHPVIIQEGAPAFELDIDGNGIRDFAFKAQRVQEPDQSFTFIYVDPLTEQVHQQATTLQSCSFARNASIRLEIETGSTRYWSNSRGILVETEHFANGQQRDGQFLGSTPLYLGVKVIRGENTYLGWVELHHEVAAGVDRIYITRAAINKQAGLAITAGA